MANTALLLKEMRTYWWSYVFIAPFFICFTIFVVIPVLAAIFLSFTYYNAVEKPTFIGWTNFQNLFSQDLVFLKHVLSNTFQFAIVVGIGGYVASFVLAWLIAQIPNRFRIFYALAIYTPSLTTGVAMAVIWGVMFTGDRTGYLNSFLLEMGWIEQPILWVTDREYLMPVMMLVSIWGSMGVGFLAMLAGVLNVDASYYEAARIDGMKSRLQEIWYITIPMMKPQMLFGAVMAIVGTFKSGIGATLSGQNPTPDYAGQLIINHIDDFGFIRYEMGYAATLSVVLLLIMFGMSRLFWRLFGVKGGE
jgi:multiple sugar transport system permease protein